MGKYETLRDSLICEKNDSIDNAAHDVICAVVNKKYIQEKTDAVNTLLNVLMPNSTVLLENTVDVNELLTTLESQISAFTVVKSGDDVDWNMDQIAAVTEIVEGALDKKNVTICHPYFSDDEDNKENENYDEDNGGILCCLSYHRCNYCPERKTRENAD